MEYRFNINPNTKPRQTRSDKWKKRPCVVQYRGFADELRFQAKEAGYTLPQEVNVVFVVKMPESWSAKKKQAHVGQKHESTPDVDNFLKALFDALSKQDKRVHTVCAKKIWGYEGQIIIHEP